jgi:hypothetical protein
VKVLDFGLAKMSRTSSIERAKSTETHVHAHLKTGPGVCDRHCCLHVA